GAGRAGGPADGGGPAGGRGGVVPGLAGARRALAGDRVRLVHRSDEPEVVFQCGEINEIVGDVVRAPPRDAPEVLGVQGVFNAAAQELDGLIPGEGWQRGADLL